MTELPELMRMALQNHVIGAYKIGRLSDAGARYHLDKLGMSPEFIDSVIASKQKIK